MDLLDKVLLEWSVRCEKGYPDFNNEQDLALFESMFGFNLLEGSLGANSKKAGEILLNKYPDIFSKLSDKYRVGNKGKISPDDFIKIIQDTFKATPEIHPPNSELNSQQSIPKGSSKFNRFIFNTEEGEVSLILAGGPKAETSERQERGIIDAVNSVKGVKTVIGSNNFNVEKVVSADKVVSNYKHEPYADIQFIIQNSDDPYMVSAKGLATPSIAGGGLSGFTQFGDKVRDFISNFYNDAYEYYRDIFEKNEEITYETDLYRTKYFPDVNRKVPSNLVLEILRGTSAMGGPVDAYYIGKMDVSHEIKGNKIYLDGKIIPIEEFAKNSDIFVHIKKRSGSYFFTDSTQTINGLTIPRIFTDKPNGTLAKSRLGSNPKPRGRVII